MQIAGRTALVTGAAAGTGRVIANRLTALDARVVAADLADGIDVTDDNQLEQLIEDAQPAILVDNAGGGGHIPPHYPEATPAEWGAKLGLNLRAPMLATQLALAAGAEAVVNIASSGGVGLGSHPSPEYAAAPTTRSRAASSFSRVASRRDCYRGVADRLAQQRQ